MLPPALEPRRKELEMHLPGVTIPGAAGFGIS
jgi:hypothetical protein